MKIEIEKTRRRIELQRIVSKHIEKIDEMINFGFSINEIMDFLFSSSFIKPSSKKYFENQLYRARKRNKELLLKIEYEKSIHAKIGISFEEFKEKYGE